MITVANDEDFHLINPAFIGPPYPPELAIEMSDRICFSVVLVRDALPPSPEIPVLYPACVDKGPNNGNAELRGGVAIRLEQTVKPNFYRREI
jgi:hypothetical protein